MEGPETAEGSFKAIAVATLLVVAISSSVFIHISTLPSDSDTTNSLNIASLWICGNSTDILYPELMEASLAIQGSSLMITASFVDDSEGYENPLIYERDFTVTPEEIENISLSLHEGLNHTQLSEMSPSTILEPSFNLGFEIEIVYSNGSWVYVITFQVDEGYIMFKSGTGTPDRSLSSDILLEPVTALDGLVETIHTVFSNHL